MEALESKLSKLSLIVGASEDGTFTVVSQSEPRFCFVRRTQAEIAQVVEKALTSYAKVFYGLDVTIKVEEKNEPIPVRTIRPVSRLFPIFGTSGKGQLELA